MFENSVTYLSVLNALSATPTTPADLAVGSGAFFTEAGALQTTDITASEAKFFWAAKNSQGAVVKSPLFKGTSINAAASADGVAVTEQVFQVGYNGSTGSMDSTVSTYYSLRLVLNHTFGLLNNSPMMKTVPYKSAASTSQYAISNGLAAAGAKVFARGVNKDVIFEVLSDEAGVAPDNIVTAINGANTVTFTTAAEHSVGTPIVVGDFLRLGILGGTASTVADGVYKVTAVNSLVLTLDRKVEVASGAYAVTEADIIVAATGDAAECGIQLTGNSITDANFNPVTDRPFVVNFDIDLGENFSTATITEATQANIGEGTYQLIGAKEAYTQFQMRDRHIQMFPPTVRIIDAVATKKYDSVTFSAFDNDFVDATTGGQPKSIFNIQIAIEDGLTDTNDYTIFIAVVGL